MEKKTERITIAIAIIGLIGTLGGAFLANYDKLFPPETKIGKSDETRITQPPTSDVSACVPQLRMPANGAVLDQVPTSDGKYEKKWMFGWLDCPEAERYHLYVIGPGALNPIVDISTLTSAVHQYRRTSYGTTKLHGWTWKVRAFVDGNWGSWSQKRQFSVNPK